MKVIVAKSCGFCVGVRRAVDTALSVSPENTYVLGELIHNGDVVRRIEERGLKTVESLDEVPNGATLLIRSHGATRAVFEECKARAIDVIDCTCSFVKKIQGIVERESAAGKTVAIVGMREHPEVQGLMGWVTGEVHVFSSEEDDFSALREKSVVLVSQTTFSEKRFSKIAENLQKVCLKTVEIFPTICYTTICRQREAEKIARSCDAVLVIGGLNSSNTNKLCEIASAHCDRVIRLKNADGFKYEQIKFCKRVGVIAGASTPDWQTQEVLFKMAENNAEVQETTETVVPETVTEAAPAAEVEVKTEPTSMEDVMANIDSQKRYRKNQILTCTIVSADFDGIYVSGSGKGEIYIDKSELDCEEYAREQYATRVGETIEVMVLETQPQVKLSEKAIKRIREEEEALSGIKNGEEFTVECTGFNKGGLTATLGSYSVFVPAREIRSGYVKELDKYVGKKLRLVMLEIKTERRKEIIASQRKILEAEKAEREAAKAEREAAFFASIQVGDIVEGKVERVTSFGAFVSVNGFDCLAHISDLSWTGVKEVTEVLEIGKRYEFQVLKVDSEKKKVSIGYKQLQPQPWDLAAEKYAVGDIVHGKVVRIVSFGAFVELEKGIDGLVHVSQISHEWLENPTSVLTIGEEIDAKVTAFDPAEHKITLSIKALQPRPEEESFERAERPQKGRKNARRAAPDEDGEYREWNEGGYGGASIADLLRGEDK